MYRNEHTSSNVNRLESCGVLVRLKSFSRKFDVYTPISTGYSKYAVRGDNMGRCIIGVFRKSASAIWVDDLAAAVSMFKRFSVSVRNFASHL